MKLKVLSALDTARTQWYHFRAIIIAGMGFFTDAYDLFVIPPLSSLLGRLYYDNKPLPPATNSLVNGIALCGALAGQLFFGWLGDRMGRKKVYGITLTLMVGSSIASGFSMGSSKEAVITSLCFFRFWLGFGIGGDYPLSATIMAEYANTTTRGGFMAAVFAMQGLGILAGSIVTMIISACFKNGSNSTPSFTQEDMVWRIILMIGAIPALFTYYWRMKMPETARYTALVEKNVKQAAADMSRVLDLDLEEDEEKALQIEIQESGFGLFSKSFVKSHGKYLLGTAATWFFVDIAFYSSNLFQKDIYTALGWLHDSYKNPLREVFEIAKAQAIIALFGTLPGYIASIFLVDRIGRFRIQLRGFFFMMVFLFALGGPHYSYWQYHVKGFLTMYSLTFFFANFGPNTTTFIVPAELFPARLRSTCNGISAAAGKAGAIIGVFGFHYVKKPEPRNSNDHDHGHRKGIEVRNALMILATASFLGMLFTFLIPETKGRSLEENEEEHTNGSLGNGRVVSMEEQEATATPSVG